jgi:sensor c-di-GMP phosphodiesterase-like protein
VNGTRGRGDSLWVGLAVAVEAAQKLKLVAIADGIGSSDDWNLLQDLHCHLGQGPLIAPPMAGARVPQWLQAWPPAPRRGIWTPSAAT